MPRTWWQPVIPGTAAISPWQRYSVEGCQWRRLTNKCWTFKTKTGQLVWILDYAIFHPVSRAFLSLAWFWRTQERHCLNRVRSLLSMRRMLLGYSSKPGLIAVLFMISVVILSSGSRTTSRPLFATYLLAGSRCRRHLLATALLSRSCLSELVNSLQPCLDAKLSCIGTRGRGWTRWSSLR